MELIMRPRRLRRTEALRRMVRETRVSAASLKRVVRRKGGDPFLFGRGGAL